MKAIITREAVLTLALSGLTVLGLSGSLLAADATIDVTPSGSNATVNPNGAPVGVSSDRSNLDRSYANSRQLSDLESREIRDRLAKTVNSAVTKGGFSDLVGDLSKADRDRIGDFKNQDFKSLDGRIDQFNKDWQSKYNHSFNLTSSKGVLDNVRIVEGADKDHAVVIFPADYIGSQSSLRSDVQSTPINTSVKPDVNARLDKTGANVDINNPSLNTGKRIEGGMDKKIDQPLPSDSTADLHSTRVVPSDSTVARSDLNANLGQPLMLQMVRDSGIIGNMWRIDVPDSLTGQGLQQSLLNRLTKLDEDRANWPANESDAYKSVAFNVFQALTQPAEMASPNITIER